ncbi:MAG: hypothetical protein HEQ35_02865 [Gloeotrichia echinulata IR180]
MSVRGYIAGDWGLGTLRQAQCIAGDTSASSVHRWVTSLIVSRFYHQLMS